VFVRNVCQTKTHKKRIRKEGQSQFSCDNYINVFPQTEKSGAPPEFFGLRRRVMERSGIGKRTLSNLSPMSFALVAAASISVFGPPASAQRPSAPTPLPQDGFAITRPIPKTIRFLVSVPKDYKTHRHDKFPLILFLHGSGERGFDLNDVRKHGPPKEIAAGRELPFVIVSPQCDTGKNWDTDQLSVLLDEIEKRYRVDKEREYLTGLSMGGFGTWALAIAEPNRFAAIAPISGGGDPDAVAVLKDVPVWVTHGDSDPTVSIEQDRRMVDALKAAGGDVRFDVIVGGQHDVWSDVYRKDDLYTWFLTHRLHHSTVNRITQVDER